MKERGPAEILNEMIGHYRSLGNVLNTLKINASIAGDRLGFEVVDGASRPFEEALGGLQTGMQEMRERATVVRQEVSTGLGAKGTGRLVNLEGVQLAGVDPAPAHRLQIPGRGQV